MITPILAGKENHGMIYLANATDHLHYTLEDMDYLILISIHLAYAIKRL